MDTLAEIQQHLRTEEAAKLLIQAEAIRELATHYRGTSETPIWSPSSLNASLVQYAENRKSEALRLLNVTPN